MEIAVIILSVVYTLVLSVLTNKYVKEMRRWFGLLGVAYATILRPLVAEKVKDSSSEIDDFILEMLDKLFDYG